MDLERLVSDLHTFQELLFHVGNTCGRKERGEHVFMRKDVIEHRARFDYTGPTNSTWHSVGAFPVSSFLVSERRLTAVGPSHLFRAVVGRIHHDGVVFEAEFFQFVEQQADVVIVLEHTIGINTEASLTFPFGRKVRPNMHARRVPPEEEWLVPFLRIVHKAERFLRKFIIYSIRLIVSGPVNSIFCVPSGLAQLWSTPRVAYLLRISGSLK